MKSIIPFFGHSFAYVAHFMIFGGFWIPTQSDAVASGLATNLPPIPLIKSIIRFFNNSNLHAIISTSLLINLHWVKKFYFAIKKFLTMLFLIGQPFQSLAIIQLHALSLLQKALQIREQFFLYMVLGTLVITPLGPYTARNYLWLELCFVKEIRRVIEWLIEIKTADQHFYKFLLMQQNKFFILNVN